MNNLRLPAEILQALANCETIFVGFSGGLDSSVLLHCLAQIPVLHSKLQAVHIHHGLSPHANEWQSHCEAFSRSLRIPFHAYAVQLPSHRNNIEAKARAARYQVFERLMHEKSALVLAHHQDDQVETFLLQLFRGAGLRGMAGIPRIKSYAGGILIRPFLEYRRDVLCEYASAHHLHWVEDESNWDTRFSRNFLRHEILPQLKQHWPGIEKTIFRAAKLADEAQQLLSQFAHCEVQADLNLPYLPITKLHDLSEQSLRNVLREWIATHQAKMPEEKILLRVKKEVLEAKEDAVPSVEWGKWALRRFSGNLHLVSRFKPSYPKHQFWHTFPELLTFEGLGTLQAKIGDKGIALPENALVEIKFRKGGERLLLGGMHKSLKKLFQEWKIPPWLREEIPLIYVNHALVAVVGYAYADAPKEGGTNHQYEFFWHPLDKVKNSVETGRESF